MKAKSKAEVSAPTEYKFNFDDELKTVRYSLPGIRRQIPLLIKPESRPHVMRVGELLRPDYDLFIADDPIHVVEGGHFIAISDDGDDFVFGEQIVFRREHLFFLLSDLRYLP